MNMKYQIFVSSTFEDLREERQQVVKAILEMGHIPVGMEMFSAADEQQWKLISRQISVSDYYVVIIAHRYGSMEGFTSFTEKEYDFAVKSGVPVLSFVIAQDAAWPADRMEADNKKREALAEFKSKLRNKYVGIWSTAQDLYGGVPIALMKQMNANPRVGWIRANEVAGPETTVELTRLSRENANLRKQLAELLSLTADEQRSERERIVQSLKANQVTMLYWYEKATEWSPPKPESLYEVFRLLGPELMVEQPTGHINTYLATMLRPDKKALRKNYPIPRNYVQMILADLATLDLVEPSKRKHSAKDINEYWTLTELGHTILRQIRRTRLQAGLGEAEEQSKLPPSTNDEPTKS